MTWKKVYSQMEPNDRTHGWYNVMIMYQDGKCSVNVVEKIWDYRGIISLISLSSQLPLRFLPVDGAP